MADNSNGGGGHPILRIPVDSSEVDEALAKAAKLKEEFASLGNEGEKLSRRARRFQKQRFETGTPNDSFRSIRRDASDPKMTGNDSFVAKFDRSSRESAKSWSSISKSAEKTFQTLTGIGRQSIGLNSSWAKLGKLLGPVGMIAGAAVGGTIAAAGNFAGKNREAKELGLPVGAADLFDSENQQYGIGKDDLQRINQLRQNQQNLRLFAALGINANEAQSASADRLAFETMQAVATKRQQMGNSYALWAQATGADQLFSQNQANALGTYGPNAVAASQQDYSAKLPDFAASAKAADEATAAWRTFTTDLSKNLIKLDQAFTPLMPTVAKLADGFSDAVSAFAKSPELSKDIDGLANAFTQLEKPVSWIADKLKPLSNDTSQLGGAGIDVVKDLKHGNFGAAWNDLNKPITGDTPAWVPEAQKSWLSKTPFGQFFMSMTPGQSTASATPTAGTSTQTDWIKSALPVIRDIESSGNPNAVNKKTGAAGLYGITPDNAKAYGIDPKDPVASQRVATSLLSDYFRLYKGDKQKALAAYDWGPGNLNKDIAKHGDDWLRFAPQETRDYLAKARDRGLSTDAFAPVPTQQGGPGGFTWANVTESINKLVQHVEDMTRDGAGSKYRSPDKPIDVNVDAKSTLIIYNQAGSNIGVSTGGVPQ